MIQEIKFDNIRTAEVLSSLITELKKLIEDKINLNDYTNGIKPISLSSNLMQRLSFMAGLCQDLDRDYSSFDDIKLISNYNFHPSVFIRHDLTSLYSALLKTRYSHLDIDWESTSTKSKIINFEMIQGANFLMADNNLDEWLLSTYSNPKSGAHSGFIPVLNLLIGKFADDLPAELNLNGLSIPNSQILISGSTGSGKTNLLAVLLNQIRSTSIETSYPVNFLLFDYKGEFSDPDNKNWLSLFNVDESCIYDPIYSPLPFSPFKDFRGKPQNEINLYATELSNALISIDRATISANMSNRLAEAVINCYKITEQQPINFQLIADEYRKLLPNNDPNYFDSVLSLLNQLIRSNLFSDSNDVDLINNSVIIKLSGFPKDGPLAKAIVYFTIASLNNYYEILPAQLKSEDCVQIRHLTVIDEAHYMIDFDNGPLRNLIAVGRNKGMTLILATQNMESFKSEYFDFYANAQYPLLMRQQTINDKIIKDLFSVSGNEFIELKKEIGNLQKGEVILKNQTAVALGLGKKFKKIMVSHLI